MDADALSRENTHLKDRLAEVEAALAEVQEANRRLEDILRSSQRERFGKRSGKLSPDQFNLALEGEPPRRHRFEPGGERTGPGCARGRAGEGRGRAATGARGRTSKAKAEPWSSAAASAPDRAGDRARQHALPLRLWRDGPDRRRHLRTARRDPGAVPGPGDAAPKICLPPVLAGHRAGACSRACRARRNADRAADCRSPSGSDRWRRDGSPSSRSSVTTFRSTARPGSSSGRGCISAASRPRHARQLDGARLLPPDAGHRPHAGPSARCRPHLRRWSERDHGPSGAA